MHNAHVVADLERQGAVFVDELDQVPDGTTVVFSAHGVAPAVRDEAARRGLNVIDATCPLVAKVHTEARRFVGRGDTVLLIGHAGHDETEGTLGEAPGTDHARRRTPAEAERVEVDDPDKVAFLMQTTLAVDEAAETVDVLRRRFPLIESSADRRHLLRDHEPAAGGAGDRRGVRRRARARLGELVELAAAGRGRRALRHARRTWSTTPTEMLPEWLHGRATSASPRARPRRRTWSTRSSARLRALGPVDVDERARRARRHHVHPSQRSCRLMAIPLRQGARIGWYLFTQKVRRREKFPLIVELEPLFACNLKCNGCGKIQQPHDVLRQRMPVEQAVAAIEECGAPMVSIAGGEPLMHPQIDEMVNELVKRKKYVYLCTNAELVRKRWDKFDFKPSPYFSFAIHIDGLRERHDESVAKEGVFDEAIAAIKFLKEKGFRVTTNSTFFNTDTPQTIIDVMNFLNDEVKVDSMMISPAYAYEKAPDQDHFLGVTETRELFAQGVRRRQPQALAAEPLAAVPRLPRGQDRLRVHRVGHPVLLAARAGSGPAT